MLEIQKTLGPVGLALENIADVKDRATHKGVALSGLQSSGYLQGRVVCGDFEVEIRNLRAITFGVQYEARVFQGGQAVGMGRDGSVEWERFRVFNPPILVADENDDFFEDLEAAFLNDLAHTLKVKQQKFGPENIQSGKVGSTSDTFYPAADAYDAWIYVTDADWATARGASTGTLLDNTELDAIAKLQGGNYTIGRSEITWDVSAIGSDTVDTATLSLCGMGASVNNGDTTDMDIVSASPSDPTSIVAGDYDLVGSTVYASLALSSWVATAGTYNDFPLDAAGKTYIEGKTYASFGVRIARDTDNSAPTAINDVVFQGSNYTGTTRDPKLVVEHTASAPAPSVFDTVTITESITMGLEDDPSVFDTVTITEDVTMMVSLDINVNESITVTDVITGAEVIGGANVFDTVTITESVTVFIEQLVPEVSDDVTITEAITMHLDLNIDVADDVAVSESVDMSQPVEISVFDTVSVTESVTPMVSLEPNVNDTVTVTDAGGADGLVTVAAARDGLVRMRSTEQDYPIMMDSDEVS